MKFNVLLISILFVSILYTMPIFSQPSWTMLNYSKERTSWAAEEGVLHPPLQQVNKYINHINDVCQSMTWLDNILIVGLQNDPNIFIAYNTETGDTLWTLTIPESKGSVNFSAAQNDSLAFLGGQSGNGLYAVYRETGQVKWFRPTRSLYGRNPILDENRLYIVADSLLCLDINDGSKIWGYSFTATVSPAVDDYNCYISGNNKTIAFDKMTGDKKWEQFNFQKNYSALAVDAMRVYTQTSDSLVARSKVTGDIEWAYRLEGAQFTVANTNCIAICDSFICLGVWSNPDTLGQLYTLNKTDGSYRWHYTFDVIGVFSPVIANNVVYAITFNGHYLYGFDISTGDVLLMDNSNRYRGQPIVANHKLYVGTNYHVVVFGNVETSIADENRLARKSYQLLSNYPNPFNATTTIQFELLHRSRVNLKIYNTLGQQVAALANDVFDAGRHRIRWNPGNLTSGIYLCKIEVWDKTKEAAFVQEVKKIILQK